MADKKVSQLQGTLQVNPFDLVMVVQDGENKKVPVSVLTSTLAGPRITSGFLSILSKNNSTSGAFLPVDKSVVHVKDLGNSPQKTLPDGMEGQVLTIIVDALPEPLIVSPTNSSGFFQIEFTDVGASVELFFTDGKWFVISAFNVGIS